MFIVVVAVVVIVVVVNNAFVLLFDWFSFMVFFYCLVCFLWVSLVFFCFLLFVCVCFFRRKKKKCGWTGRSQIGEMVGGRARERERSISLAGCGAWFCSLWQLADLARLLGWPGSRLARQSEQAWRGSHTSSVNLPGSSPSTRFDPSFISQGWLVGWFISPSIHPSALLHKETQVSCTTLHCQNSSPACR